MLGIKDISEATVDAGHRFAIVKVDEDLGVTQSSTATVTGDLQIRNVNLRLIFSERKNKGPIINDVLAYLLVLQ